jgi:hypothetical protein
MKTALSFPTGANIMGVQLGNWSRHGTSLVSNEKWDRNSSMSATQFFLGYRNVISFEKEMDAL